MCGTFLLAHGQRCCCGNKVECDRIGTLGKESGMNTCGTCKFKGEELMVNDDDFNQIPSGYFRCARVKQRDWFPKEGNDKGYRRGEHALVEDGSGYYAALCVENDFGCNLWESGSEL